MNEAHVFQHKYTGVQIFVYQKQSIDDAETEFSHIVFNPVDWVYLCKKTATDVIVNDNI